MLAANPAYYHLYGLQPEQVIGQKFYRIFPENMHAQAMKQYRVVFESPPSRTMVESVVRHADGTARVVETHVDFVVLNGERAAMLSSIRDITARKQADVELRQAKEELERRVAERTAALHRANQELHLLTQKVVDAQEAERRRVALELHDQIGQTLTAVNLNLQLLEGRVPGCHGGGTSGRKCKGRSNCDRSSSESFL